MPRTNPEQFDPNPATRYFEWDGESGVVRWYDKEKKQNVVVGAKFPFVLLNRLCSVRGWHEPSKSGIISNEIKDTREQVLTVRAFNGGTIATGLYRDIKDKVTVAGGHYTANLYIAFRPAKGQPLAIGQLQLKGAGLGGWMVFEKKHRNDMYKAGIKITGCTDGKNGKVVFKIPTFEVFAIEPKEDDEAGTLQEVVSQYLTRYFAKSSSTKVASAAEAPQPDAPEEHDQTRQANELANVNPDASDDDVPF